MRRPPNLAKDTAAFRPAPAPQPPVPQPPSNYLDLYGLSKPPFGGTPDSAGYILFGSHRRAFELLIDHIVNGTGLLLVQGQEEIGKTETLRAAAAVASESAAHTVVLSRPPGGRTSLLQLVSALLGQDAADESRTQDAITHFLQPPRKSLLIDDFDMLPDDCVHLLSSLVQAMPNYPDGSALVLSTSIDLTAEVQRPELSQILSHARNTIRLLPLGPAEIRQYIERSLWVSGGTTRRLITADAMKVLIARSGGVPGMVNRLMEAAFTAGFARGDTLITAKTVAAAMGPTVPRPVHRENEHAGITENAVPIVAIGLLLIGVSVFIYQGLAGQREHPVATPKMSIGPSKPLPPPVTPPPVKQAYTAQPADTLSPALVAALIKRGDQSLELGDIAAARLLFQRAAEAGNAGAATSLGKTFDPGYTAPGGRPDPARAAEWYQKALLLGDGHAGDLLKRLGTH